jgi:predicted ATP-dependent endonuclease of OLD family
MYGIGATDHTLPESYNGLGYMNLISMIFEIKILLHEFQKEKNEKPSDINLLFIEEPEVHTHPQMQRIFIKNIKTLLQNGFVREDGESRKLQTMLSTHSSYIVSESDFEDIKYFKRTPEGVLSKNLKELRDEYGAESAYYKFLKQYLTLHRSELFFADKAIFIEGDTERILLPAMMKKIDQDDIKRETQEDLEPSLPLLSQNVSIIEVGGRHFDIFDKFINFVGIKTLIVTDIDSVKAIKKEDKNGKEIITYPKCPVSEGCKTDNQTINYFFSKIEFSALRNLGFKQKIFSFEDGLNCFEGGNLACIYQIEENNYHARSFEDAFINVNGDFIAVNNFEDLKTKNAQASPYELAGAIKKKSSFATDILLNSKEDNAEEFSNWNIPAYIREGLQWLKQD